MHIDSCMTVINGQKALTLSAFFCLMKRKCNLKREQLHQPLITLKTFFICKNKKLCFEGILFLLLSKPDSRFETDHLGADLQSFFS